MLKLRKHLKPFIGLILAAIVLLFIQAIAELSLPDYMSRIVNNGIQQGGISNSVPEAIREAQMNKLMLFMKENDISEVSKFYTLVDKSNSNYEEYVKRYPRLAKEAVYVRKDMNDKEIEMQSPIMGKALIALFEIDSNKYEIVDDTDMFALAEKINEKFTVLGDSMIVQAASGIIKAEYQALGIDTDKMQNEYIGNTGLIMLLISVVSALCIILVGFFSSKVAAGLARNLRRDVFSKVENFSSNELDKFSTASLITRTTNDITQIQMLIVIMIRIVFFAPIMGIGGIIMALAKSPSMSWIIAVAVASILCLISAVFLIAMPKFKIIQKLLDRLNLVTRENLSGIMVIRAFNTQRFEENRFDKANKDITSTNLFVNRVMVLMFPTMMLIMNGITLLIVWVGANQIANSSMQVGDMMAFMQYAMLIIFSFLMMSFVFIMIPRATIAAQRIYEVLETEPEIKDPEKGLSFDKDASGVIEFRNVSFRYNCAEEDMLKDISFKALPGKTTAIIGSTGSGKTTLVNLIPRFYDVTKGQVIVNGLDVREVTQHDLREKIGYVPQKNTLFSGTIESNLKYANEDATVKELEEASEIAQAMEFIKEKLEGFKERISQGGSNVSGGQKQRLSIARALIKKPKILIFDDSFSALDFKTDSSLRKALLNNTKSSTILIVAQRISTIMNADQIIVLDEGRIVGMGKHRDLIESCSAYQEIAFSQLSKEELA